MTRGRFAYDFGDVAGMTPLLAMHTLGHQFIPPAIHAGGLRYHGMAPLVLKVIWSDKGPTESRIKYRGNSLGCRLLGPLPDTSCDPSHILISVGASSTKVPQKVDRLSGLSPPALFDPARFRLGCYAHPASVLTQSGRYVNTGG